MIFLITKEYRKFKKDGIIKLYNNKEFTDRDIESDFFGTTDTSEVIELVGDTTLTKMLYERQLCGMYSKEKLDAFRDLVESTEDRLIVFYNFKAELEALKTVISNNHISMINGLFCRR